jgi:hypothetical protein
MEASFGSLAHSSSGISFPSASTVSQIGGAFSSNSPSFLWVIEMILSEPSIRVKRQRQRRDLRIAVLQTSGLPKRIVERERHMKQNQKTLRQFCFGEKSIRRTGTRDIKQMPLAWRGVACNSQQITPITQNTAGAGVYRRHRTIDIIYKRGRGNRCTIPSESAKSA